MATQSVRDYINSLYPSCVVFARDILGWPIYRSGDRTLSLGSDHHNYGKNLVVFNDFWYDHKNHIGGDIISLCAHAMFDGDRGKAFKFLAGDFFPVKSDVYISTVKALKRSFKEWHQTLRPIDRDYLHSRKITDETIERLQLGFDPKEHRLMIPYFRNGDIVYWVGRETLSYEKADLRRRYDAGEEGIEWKQAYGEAPKLAKYKKRYCDENNGVSNIPWGLHTLYKKKSQLTLEDEENSINKADWLIICEGAFDALSFEQEGYSVLCSMGGRFNAIEAKSVMDIARTYKNVLVVYDNDNAGSSFQKDMCMNLFAHQVNFFCGHVPTNFQNTQCKDVSDFYSAGGNLAELISSAAKGTYELASMISEQKEFLNFMLTAGKFAMRPELIELFDMMRGHFAPGWLKAVRDITLKAPAEKITVDDVLSQHKLLFSEGLGFLEYVHGVWHKTSENEIHNYVSESLGNYANYGRMKSVTGHIKARTTTMQEFNTQSILNLRNGVLLLDQDCKFVPHDEGFFSSIQLKNDYDPEATCPLFLKFVDEIMESVTEKKLLLQEIAGYVLFPDNSLEKAFFLIGSGGNGKGVFINILQEVFGEENCSAVEPSKFNSDFDPIMLRYALVNLCTEARVDMKSSEARFKGIVSGDPITAAHKGVDAIKFRPRCKIITSCNDFVNSNDMSHAFLRRLKFVKFNRNYEQLGIQDTELLSKLKGEIPGILNWAIEGYRRLRANKRFTTTLEEKQVKDEFLENMNPLVSFIKEKLIDVYDELFTIKELFRDYISWCKDFNTTPMSQTRFSRTLKTLMASMRPDVEFKRGAKNTLMVKFPSSTKIDFDHLDAEGTND